MHRRRDEQELKFATPWVVPNDVDLRDPNAQTQQERLQNLEERAESLVAFIRKARQHYVTSEVFEEIATIADGIHEIATNDHERTP